MSTFSVEPIQSSVSEALASELTAFWLAEKALNEHQARDRLGSVTAVLRDGSGDLAGSSSCVVAPIVTVASQPFHVFRCLLRSQANTPENWMRMLETSVALVDEEAGKDRAGASLGMAMLLTEPAMQRAFPQAIWPNTGFVHAGFMDSGAQLRIRYFENRRIAAGARP